MQSRACRSLLFRFAALEQTGSTYAFGDGAFGQLGFDDSEARIEPNLITALDGISVSCAASGPRHSAALAADGKVYTRGGNDLGQLGHADKPVDSDCGTADI